MLAWTVKARQKMAVKSRLWDDLSIGYDALNWQKYRIVMYYIIQYICWHRETLPWDKNSCWRKGYFIKSWLLLLFNKLCFLKLNRKSCSHPTLNLTLILKTSPSLQPFKINLTLTLTLTLTVKLNTLLSLTVTLILHLIIPDI